MKKIIIFCTMILFLGLGVNAQTLSTSTSQPSVGAIDIPVDVTGIGDVYTLTVYVEYDNSVLTYTGAANLAVPNIVVSDQNANTLKILVGTFPIPTTVSDGKLLDLQFNYGGGYSDLKFWTTTYGNFPSNMLIVTPYSTYNFLAGDVTNGAVQGSFDNTITGGDWNTAGNWSYGIVPNEFANVTVASDPSVVTTSADATANDVTIENGGKLTLSNTLTVGGDFLVESTSTGNGSFINSGGTLNVTGSTTVQSYVTGGVWHGVSAPVTGLTANDFYLGGTPEVYLKSYNEGDNTYTYLTQFTDPLAEMTGYMAWIAGSTQTFNFAGNLRTSASATLTTGGDGFNFVGNPFPCAIDWDATSGWGGTSTVSDNIWVWDNLNWRVFNRGSGVGTQTQYIAMNQGFFVQATGAGTLTMLGTGVSAYNTVPFRNADADKMVIELNLNDAGLEDQAFIVFIDGATLGYEGTFDAHKMFSFVENYPQLYSTANDNMAINSLPYDYSEPIAMDVVGADGHSMTISVNEADDFAELYLKDEFTGDVTNIKIEDYTFTYNADITDRFTLFFSITDVNETEIQSDVRVFAYDQTIQVNLESQNQSNITVYNLMGQKVVSLSTSGNQTLIPIYEMGYYIVKVSTGNGVTTQKVFIK